MTTSGVPYRKGHGTGNEFILVNGLDGVFADPESLTPEIAQNICDREHGLGADGILRVSKASEFAESFDVDDAQYFMDYTNADGSKSATCGNGLRVFARYLIEAGLENRGQFTIGTRAGTVTVAISETDTDFTNIAVTMGRVSLGPMDVTVHTETGSWPAVGIAGMNNHAISVVDDISDAGALDEIPTALPAGTYPDGVNFEFIQTKSPTHIAMRTHERGVGETLSCGSGACAAAYVHATSNHLNDPWTVQVDVLGGTVYVDSDTDGVLTLRGPAVFVAEGTIEPSLLQSK
jgi:diaminopimelate epimerase